MRRRNVCHLFEDSLRKQAPPPRKTIRTIDYVPRMIHPEVAKKAAQRTIDFREEKKKALHLPPINTRDLVKMRSVSHHTVVIRPSPNVEFKKPVESKIEAKPALPRASSAPADYSQYRWMPKLYFFSREVEERLPKTNYREHEIIFHPRNRPTVKCLAKAILYRKQTQLALNKKQDGYCLGFLILYFVWRLQGKDPKDLYRLVKLITCCPSGLLHRQLGVNIKEFFVPLEWAQWASFYTKRRTGGAISHLNIDILVQEISGLSIEKQLSYDARDYSADEILSSIATLATLGTNAIMVICNVPPVDQALAATHIIGVEHEAAQYTVIDANDRTDMPDSFVLPADRDELMDKIKSMLYTNIGLTVPTNDQYRLKIQIIAEKPAVTVLPSYGSFPARRIR